MEVRLLWDELPKILLLRRRRNGAFRTQRQPGKALTAKLHLPKGMQYFISQRLVKDVPIEIARFLHNTKRLNSRQTRLYLESRRQVLDHLVELQNFENQHLPEALRRFFQSLQAPNTQNSYLRALLEKFSLRFCKCNPHLGLSSDMVYILCFSLIMLSVDLSSPHIKNKMSKREFIRNVRQAVHRTDDEFYGHLYDDIYLRGHVAPNSED
ncbi:hypothetical protein HPB51_002339 [Rhipicephalus microplus]|uniref:SEC7 domain-containing protein n=1 Tax=Rhipicephalus microplus TaxID=6941 RepID=A0A9J6DRU7_RHIMP|nr:hypothetical protein HPB51_002339 [Rhipicephalus microplus]